MQLISPTYKIDKAYFLIGFFCLFTLFSFSQNQKKSDSLKQILRTNEYDRSKKLQILADIAYFETDTDEIVIYGNELIASAKEMDSLKRVFEGYLQVGNAYRLKSDLAQALDYYFNASKVAEDLNDKSKLASIKIALADVYSIQGNSETSVRNYKESISLLKTNIKNFRLNKIDKRLDSAQLKKLVVRNNKKMKAVEMDSINLASAQLNLGDEYYNQQELDSALHYFKKSGNLFKELKSEIGLAYNLGNVGLVYAEKNENEKAQENIYQAIEVLEKLEDYYPISVYLNAMSDVYLDKGNKAKALSYMNRSLEISKKYGLKDQMSESYFKLSEFYEKSGDYKKSYFQYKNYVAYRDSVNNIEKVQDMANAEKDYEVNLANEKAKFEVDKAEQEKEILKQEKKTQFILNIGIGIVLILIGFLAYFLYKRNKLVVETSKIIEQEKERSDDLLKNILPEETAQELKEKGSVEAKRFDSVSVLFTDFKGFTKFSETLSPEELVKTIDYYFSKFDEIMEKHGIEKIKTVGDAYMCASGLPFPVENHAFKMVKAAFDIIDFVNEAMSLNAEASFDIRVGINSGSVVAGVVGTKKFAYDIWGDTVNTASRMESSGEIGKINISESTYNLLKNNRAFEFEERGSIEAKGKGKIKMYFVRRTT